MLLNANGIRGCTDCRIFLRNAEAEKNFWMFQLWYPNLASHLSQPTDESETKHTEATDRLPDPTWGGLTISRLEYPDTRGKTPEPVVWLCAHNTHRLWTRLSTEYETKLY